QQEDWVNAGAMLARMTFAVDLAAGRIAGVRVAPPSAGAAAPAGAAPGAGVPALLGAVLPAVDTSGLAARIAAELERQDAPLRQRARFVLGLALGSPEFQRK